MWLGLDRAVRRGRREPRRPRARDHRRRRRLLLGRRPRRRRDRRARPRAGGALAGMRIVGRAALRLHELAKPTIAAVNGVAAGAGCNSRSVRPDRRVGRARFSEIFSKRGLVVDFGGSWVLPRLVGMHRAKELVLLADMIDATEAERIGLVNRVVAARSACSTTVARDRRPARATWRRSRWRCRSGCSTRRPSVSMAEAIEAENTAQALDARRHATPREAILAFFEAPGAQLHRRVSRASGELLGVSGSVHRGARSRALRALASRSGSCTRRSQAPCHSHAAEQHGAGEQHRAAGEGLGLDRRAVVGALRQLHT